MNSGVKRPEETKLEYKRPERLSLQVTRRTWMILQVPAATPPPEVSHPATDQDQPCVSSAGTQGRTAGRYDSVSLSVSDMKSLNSRYSKAGFKMLKCVFCIKYI